MYYPVSGLVPQHPFLLPSLSDLAVLTRALVAAEVKSPAPMGPVTRSAGTESAGARADVPSLIQTWYVRALTSCCLLRLDRLAHAGRSQLRFFSSFILFTDILSSFTSRA